MKLSLVLSCLSLLFVASKASAPDSVAAASFFAESFADESWTQRWIQPHADQAPAAASTQSKSSDSASDSDHDWSTLRLHHGKWYGDAVTDSGLQTATNFRNYFALAKTSLLRLDSVDELVLQYSVKQEQMIECGGLFVKLFQVDAAAATAAAEGQSRSTQGNIESLRKLTPESPAVIQFGPDFCGSETRHLLLRFRPKQTQSKSESQPQSYIELPRKIRAPGDALTHVFTLAWTLTTGRVRVFIDAQPAHYEDGHVVDSIVDELAKATQQQDKLATINHIAIGPIWQVKSGSIFDDFSLSDDLAASLDNAKLRIAQRSPGELKMYTNWAEFEERRQQKVRHENEEARKQQDAQLERLLKGLPAEEEDTPTDLKSADTSADPAATEQVTRQSAPVRAVPKDQPVDIAQSETDSTVEASTPAPAKAKKQSKKGKTNKNSKHSEL